MDSDRGKCLAKNDCVFTLMHKYMEITKRIPSLITEKIYCKLNLRKITLEARVGFVFFKGQL